MRAFVGQEDLVLVRDIVGQACSARFLGVGVVCLIFGRLVGK